MLRRTMLFRRPARAIDAAWSHLVHPVRAGFLAAIAVSLCSPAAYADPIRAVSGFISLDTIDYGALVVTVTTGNKTVDFISDSETPGTLSFSEPAAPPVLQNGAPVQLSTRVDFNGGYGRWTGSEGEVLFAGNFRFQSDPAELRLCDNEGLFCATTSEQFSFAGTLTGTDLSGRRLFSSILRGTGRSDGFADRDFGVSTLNFHFDAAPVPEPATVTFVAIGLGGTLWRIRRRRSKA